MSSEVLPDILTNQLELFELESAVQPLGKHALALVNMPEYDQGTLDLEFTVYEQLRVA